MKHRNLALSITLGIAFTFSLLAVLRLRPSTAMAAENRGVTEGTPPESAPNTILQTTDAVSTANVVVVFSGERAVVHPISWTGAISMFEALRETGLDIETAGEGLCSIEGQGCPPSDCFCPDNWWWRGLWDSDTDSWASPWSLPQPSDGDVLAFRYSRGDWGPPTRGAAPFTSSAKALEWLRAQHMAQGEFGTANDAAETLMTIGGNQLDGFAWGDDPTLMAAVLRQGTELANRNTAGAGKLALALSTQQACWPVGAMRPLDHFRPATGTFSVDTFYQTWGILGTAALSDTVPVSAVQSLLQNQQPNGGWELFVGMGSDTNTTALAVQALIAAGQPPTSTSVVSGLAYLDRAQNADGGFPWSPDSPWGTDSDVNSTSYVVQAIVATGQDPLTGTWVISNSDPISYLLSMQLQSGGFEWVPDSDANQSATRQAVLALLYRPFPLDAEAVPDCHGISGQVTSGVEGSSGSPLANVTVAATGSEHMFYDTTDAAGAYTVSVLSDDTYALTPARAGFTFSPTMRSLGVGAAPGGVTLGMDFHGAARVYLPLALRN